MHRLSYTVEMISYPFVGSVTRSDERSFHASLFEEEWRKRTSVNFDVDDVDQQVVSCFFSYKPFILLYRNDTMGSETQ